MTIVADIRPDLMPYYKDDCDPKNLAPLWEVLHTFARKTPKSDCQPYIWHYNEIRDTLMKSADLITAEQAERRVLILEKPGYARALSRHNVPVCRSAAHHAG